MTSIPLFVPRYMQQQSQAPQHVDKGGSKLLKYTLTNFDIFSQNQKNIQRYKESIPKIIYSEELLDYTRFSPENCISLEQLLNYIQLKEPYPNNVHNNFIYKNYFEKERFFFNSNFESGNLRMVIKHSDNEFDLIIRPETFSVRTFQWFFFSIKENEAFKSHDKSKIIKFNIINLTKKTILFNEMIRVLVYYNDTWSRDTNNIFFFPNEMAFNEEENQFYTLTFTFDLHYVRNNSLIYFSYCYPYTYQNLTYYLKSLTNYSSILRFESIGTSLKGNNIHMLVITDFTDSFEALARKQAVVLTARVHPGESNSSYVIEGVIDFLLSRDQVAEKLRKKYIFKIVPMLNPDGVIYGNFRMNLVGKDLNRMWVEAEANNSPTIFHTKQMIQKTLKSRDIYLFCDFHGHSTKNNFFMYCCRTKSSGFSGVSLNQYNSSTNLISTNYFSCPGTRDQTTFQERIFPYIFQKENLYFDRNSCVNKINPSKIKTARAVLKNEYKVDLSYCLESSLGSIRLANGEYIPFTIELYKKIGRDFCKTLFKMGNTRIYYSALNFVKNEKKEKKKTRDIRKIFSTSAAAKQILPYVRECPPNQLKKNSIIIAKGKNESFKVINYNNGFKYPSIDKMYFISTNK